METVDLGWLCNIEPQLFCLYVKYCSGRSIYLSLPTFPGFSHFEANSHKALSVCEHSGNISYVSQYSVRAYIYLFMWQSPKDLITNSNFQKCMYLSTHYVQPMMHCQSQARCDVNIRTYISSDRCIFCVNLTRN